MAEIYLASIGEDSAEKLVVIKVIHEANATDPDFVRMLVDEARLAVQLDHPNIVSTYDLGRENHQYYIVMEFIDGADLFKVQQRSAIKRLSFPIALGAYIAREVANGLDFAHHLKDAEGRALYIVHRDISPQNVLISFDGAVKITDFGIAKAAYRAEQTQAGIIKGKYYYMSPEQAAGRVIDARTDVFAAGILLYEMLVGEMLYYDDDVDKLLAIVRKADIVPPTKRRRDIPPELENIVMKALRKKPEERYQSAAEYATALGEFLHDFADDYGAADLGVFLTRLMDKKRGQSSSSEGISTLISAVGEQHLDTPSPTIGLAQSQIVRLGIHDENSLIFQSESRIKALLKSAEPPAKNSGRAERSGSLPGKPHPDDDSNIRTRRRFVDDSALQKKTEVAPELLEQTVPDEPDHKAPVTKPRTHKADFADDEDGQSTNPSWQENRVTRRHFGADVAGRRGPRNYRVGSPEDDDQDLPTVSHPALAPVAHRVPVGSMADDEHDAPTAPRPAEAARLARVSMEIPALDIAAARAAYAASPAGADDPGNSSRDGYRSLVFEAMPTPALNEAQVELVVSDDGFARVDGARPAGGGEPKVELMQSDAYPNVSALIAPENATQELDSISIESTQQNLSEPLMRSLKSRPSGSSTTAHEPPRRSRLGYVLSGLGAALLSAVLTWQITVGQRGSQSKNDGNDQAALGSTDAGLVLLVFNVPDMEPPPAALIGGAPEPTSAPATKAPVDAGSAAGQTTASEGVEGAGQVELNSTPEGAEVYLHRKLLGVTPLVLHDLPTDSDVRVELKLEGYKKTRKHIKWKGATSVSVVVKLKADSDSSSDSDSSGDGASDSGKAPEGEKEPAKEPAKDPAKE